jgi:maleate isomerase
MMVDVLGWRKVFAVIGPSTNTVVQPDMEGMRPAGVTNHYRDIYVEDPEALSDAAFMAGAQKITAGMREALRTALTCRPDYLVLGVSAISFMGGLAGAEDFVAEIRAFTGLGISVGSLATASALRAHGGIRRISFLSPYYPTANDHVRAFFSDCGFEVVRDLALRCTSWTHIARVGEARLREALVELDGPDVDAIVQVGTNLSMVRLAALAETWLGKPVVAINAATYWHALRTKGIEDRIEGMGALLSSL